MEVLNSWLQAVAMIQVSFKSLASQMIKIIFCTLIKT